jgi:hypothetical protein
MKKNLLFVIACFLIAASCSKDEQAHGSFSHLSLEYYERFTAEGRKMVFNLETLEQFPCSNFLIKTTVEETLDQLNISTYGLDVSNVCITAYGPATQTLFLEDPHHYSKKINLRVMDKQHEFHFTVNDHIIQVEKHSLFENHLVFTRNTLLRVPENFLWGYILINDKYDEDAFQDLLNGLNELGIQWETPEDGDYYHFNVEDGILKFKRLTENVVGLGFYFHLPFQQLVNFINEGHYQLSIRLYDTYGSSYIN